MKKISKPFKVGQVGWQECNAVLILHRTRTPMGWVYVVAIRDAFDDKPWVEAMTHHQLSVETQEMRPAWNESYETKELPDPRRFKTILKNKDWRYRL